MTEKLVDLIEDIKELKEENKRLKGVLLFFIEADGKGDEESINNLCQNIFNCSHEEAIAKYGEFSKAMRK